MQASAPQMMLGLQQLAGNRAAGVAVSGISTKSVPKKPLRLQRLATKAEFKKQTDAGFLSGRGKTMKQLDSLLDEYHLIRKDGKHLHPGAQQERCVNILHEIIEDVVIWLNTHKGDESRSKKRTPGLTSLAFEAGKELQSLEKLRIEGQKVMGQKQEPVTRTENKLKTQMDGSFTSVFAKLSPLISAAAPTSGDTAEVEVEVKIPCEPTGVGYLGFRVKAQIERLKKQAMKLRFELAFVGGAKIANVAEVGGELGVYLESQGATPEKALELISYGLYRRVRESKVIPRELGNFIWADRAPASAGTARKVGAEGRERELQEAGRLQCSCRFQRGGRVRRDGRPARGQGEGRRRRRRRTRRFAEVRRRSKVRPVVG